MSMSKTHRLSDDVAWLFPAELPQTVEDCMSYLLMMNSKAKNNMAVIRETATWNGYNGWLKIQIQTAARLAVMWLYMKEEWKRVRELDKVSGTTGNGQDDQAPARSGERDGAGHPPGEDMLPGVHEEGGN